jgi:predicted nucleic acid-binding protein
VSRFLLDTSAYSAFLRGHPELKSRIQEGEEIVVTPVVLGELKAGFRRGSHRRRNEKQLATFLSSPRVFIVNVDESTSDRFAAVLDSLRASGTPIPTNDVWIAASAMQHGLRILTTDAHFTRVTQVLTDLVEPG